MRQKKIYISFLVCVAILFKIAFLTLAFVLAKNTSQIERYASTNTFKVGKSRRRFTYYISTLNKSESQEPTAAERVEAENDDELEKNTQPVLLLLAGLFRACGFFSEQLKQRLSFVTCRLSYSLSSKKSLDISVLRI